jgi:hypothetical protein
MQPYDADPLDEQIEADLTRIARIAQLTDEDVRAMGRKEVYPGYFEDDPRHPFFSVEDRYLMDHPGPEWKTGGWKTKKRAIREELTPSRQWDEEQFTGEPMPTESLPPRPAPKIVPITTREAEGVITAESYADSFVEPRLQQSGLWICRICRKKLAIWPFERALRFKLFGLSLTVVFRSPIACTNCRVFEFPTLSRLGREDHRRFWQRVIRIWERPSLLIPGRWYQNLLVFKHRLRDSLQARRNLL